VEKLKLRWQRVRVYGHEKLPNKTETSEKLQHRKVQEKMDKKNRRKNKTVSGEKHERNSVNFPGKSVVNLMEYYNLKINKRKTKHQDNKNPILRQRLFL